jgi:hypothetical protein
MKHLYNYLLVIGLLITLQAGAQKKALSYYTENYESGKFIPYDTGVYTYNTAGLLATDTYSYYDNTAKKWIAFLKYDYKYNQSKNIESYDLMMFTDGNWEPFLKNNYTYTTQGLLDNIFEQRLQNNTWKNKTRKKHVYGANNKPDTITLYRIDSLGNETYNFRTINTYNQQNELTVDLSLWWNLDKNRWDTTGKTTYTYNSNNQQVKYEYEAYTPQGWEKVYFITLGYDNEGLHRSWERMDYSTNYVTSKGYTIYEFDGPLSAPTTATFATKVYPNPTNENPTFYWADSGQTTIEIRDATGKLVFAERNIQGNYFTLNTSTISNGLYQYTLQNNSNGTISTGRLIINK